MAMIETWTVESYLAAVEAGAFYDVRGELVDGKFVPVSPMGPDHSIMSGLLVVLLNEHLALAGQLGEWMAMGQHPVQAEGVSVPEPDVYLRRVGAPRPTQLASCAVVIEVADSSRVYDEREKADGPYKGFEPYYVVEIESREIWTRAGMVNMIHVPEISFSLAADDLWTAFDKA